MYFVIFTWVIFHALLLYICYTLSVNIYRVLHEMTKLLNEKSGEREREKKWKNWNICCSLVNRFNKCRSVSCKSPVRMIAFWNIIAEHKCLSRRSLTISASDRSTHFCFFFFISQAPFYRLFECFFYFILLFFIKLLYVRFKRQF